MWFILDVIIAAIFIVFAIIGAKRGLIKSVCGALITIVSIIIALNFYAPVADFFRSTVVYKQLTDNLNEKITDYVQNTTDEESVSELFSDAPSGIYTLLRGFGKSPEEVSEMIEEMIKSGEENVAQEISDYIVAPAAEALSNALAVLALFLASVIVLNLALLLLGLIFKLPVLRFANTLGGLIIGLIIGLMFSLVFCTVANIALPYLSGAGINLSVEDAKNAIIFTKLSEINPLSFLY